MYVLYYIIGKDKRYKLVLKKDGEVVLLDGKKELNYRNHLVAKSNIETVRELYSELNIIQIKENEFMNSIIESHDRIFIMRNIEKSQYKKILLDKYNSYCKLDYKPQPTIPFKEKYPTFKDWIDSEIISELEYIKKWELM